MNCLIKTTAYNCDLGYVFKQCQCPYGVVSRPFLSIILYAYSTCSPTTMCSQVVS